MRRRQRPASGLPEPRSIKTALTELRGAVRQSLGRFTFGAGEAASALAFLGTNCVFCDARATDWDLLARIIHEEVN